MPQRHHRVLIVEDDRHFRALLTLVLTRRDYLILACSSVEEAVVHLDKFRPHAMIVDGSLPGADGLSLCKYVRTHDRHRSIRIIAMSADPDLPTIGGAIDTPYDVFLHKPLKLHALPGLLSTLLQHRESALR